MLGVGAMGVFLLTGCQSGRRSAGGSLPGPRWPESGALSGPPLRRPAPETAPSYQPRPLPGDGGGLEPVLARSRWTGSGVARPWEAAPMRSVVRITVHHDGMTPFDSGSLYDVTDRIERIRRAHVARGWADIGYHYVIDPAGRVWEARPTHLQGAHVRDNNPQNLGILVLGNYQQQHPTRESLASLDRFVAAQMQRYRVPLSRVYTHQELSPSECPGRSLQRYMEQTRSRGGSLALAASRVHLG